MNIKQMKCNSISGSGEQRQLHDFLFRDRFFKHDLVQNELCIFFSYIFRIISSLRTFYFSSWIVNVCLWWINRCLSIVIIGYFTERFLPSTFILLSDGTGTNIQSKLCYVCLIVCPVCVRARISQSHCLYWLNKRTHKIHAIMKRQLCKISLSSFYSALRCCCRCCRFVKHYIQSIDWTPVWFLSIFLSASVYVCLLQINYTFPFFWLLFVFTPRRSNFQKLTNLFSSISMCCFMQCRQYTFWWNDAHFYKEIYSIFCLLFQRNENEDFFSFFLRRNNNEKNMIRKKFVTNHFTWWNHFDELMLILSASQWDTNNKREFFFF